VIPDRHGRHVQRVGDPFLRPRPHCIQRARRNHRRRAPRHGVGVGVLDQTHSIVDVALAAVQTRCNHAHPPGVVRWRKIHLGGAGDRLRLPGAAGSGSWSPSCRPQSGPWSKGRSSMTRQQSRQCDSTGVCRTRSKQRGQVSVVGWRVVLIASVRSHPPTIILTIRLLSGVGV